MLRLGLDVKDRTPVTVSLDKRRQVTYVIGTTSTGKSSLLCNMFYQDMRPDRKSGLCLIDPHGNLVDKLIGMVP